MKFVLRLAGYNISKLPLKYEFEKEYKELYKEIEQIERDAKKTNQ